MPSSFARSTRRKRRNPPLDRTLRRYFVYWLFDSEGHCIYIGRSCDVRARLKVHHAGTDWFEQVRGLEMEGPLTWDEAVRREGTAARAAQPAHNIVYTSRWPRPTHAEG